MGKERGGGEKHDNKLMPRTCSLLPFYRGCTFPRKHRNEHDSRACKADLPYILPHSHLSEATRIRCSNRPVEHNARIGLHTSGKYRQGTKCAKTPPQRVGNNCSRITTPRRNTFRQDMTVAVFDLAEHRRSCLEKAAGPPAMMVNMPGTTVAG